MSKKISPHTERLFWFLKIDNWYTVKIWRTSWKCTLLHSVWHAFCDAGINCKCCDADAGCDADGLQATCSQEEEGEALSSHLRSQLCRNFGGFAFVNIFFLVVKVHIVILYWFDAVHATEWIWFASVSLLGSPLMKASSDMCRWIVEVRMRIATK